MHLGKLNDTVCLSVSIIIRQNNQGIIHFLHRFPHWISWPDCGPQPSFCIHLHLHWVDQLREFFLVGKKIHFKAIPNSKALQTFFWA